MCHIPAHGDSCAEHGSQPVLYRRGDTVVLLQRLAEDPLPMVSSSRIPSPARAKPGPTGSQPGDHGQGQLPPALQWGSASSSHTEGRKAQICSILLMDSRATALLHRVWGWAGELTINPGKIVRFLLVPGRAQDTVRGAFGVSGRPALAWGCSWQGIWEVPLRQESKHLPGTELDRSKSQDFAFQLSIGNRVFLLFQVFIKIHNY